MYLTTRVLYGSLFLGLCAAASACATHRQPESLPEVHDRLAQVAGLRPLRALQAVSGAEELRLALVQTGGKPSYLLRVDTRGGRTEASLARFAVSEGEVRAFSGVVSLPDAAQLKARLDSGGVSSLAAPDVDDGVCSSASPDATPDCARIADAEDLTVELRSEASYRRHIYNAPGARKTEAAARAADLVRMLRALGEKHLPGPR